MGWSVRMRVTTLASTLTFVVLVLAGAILIMAQRSYMVDYLDRALEQRAADIEPLLNDNESAFAVLPTTLSEGFAQVVNPDSVVVGATPNLEGEPPLSVTTPSEGKTFYTMMVPTVDDDTFRVLAQSRPDGSFLVLGTTYDVVTETTNSLMTSLSLLIPAVVAVLGVLTWWLVGRTLRPVEDIRNEVAEIGLRNLDRRVPETGTGDEIDRLAATMNEMLDRLNASMERETRFVADVSHELRSPLTRLRAQVELMMKAGDAIPELSPLHEDILSMQATVEDLLFLARSDAKSGISHRELIDLDDIIFEECGHPGAVPIDVSAVGAVQVEGESSMLRRAVANLVENARRHAETAVRVGLTGDAGHAVLTVVDDGAGVPADAEEAIFDRFYRLDAARSPERGGSGLGLAIAREVAEAHDGSLRLVNPGSGGAMFEMRIPMSAGS